jgi:hypothetical protein
MEHAGNLRTEDTVEGQGNPRRVLLRVTGWVFLAFNLLVILSFLAYTLGGCTGVAIDADNLHCASKTLIPIITFGEVVTTFFALPFMFAHLFLLRLWIIDLMVRIQEIKQEEKSYSLLLKEPSIYLVIISGILVSIFVFLLIYTSTGRYI